MFVFYDWPFSHVLSNNVAYFPILILGSVFSDCVVFYGDIIFILSTAVML